MSSAEVDELEERINALLNLLSERTRDKWLAEDSLRLLQARLKTLCEASYLVADCGEYGYVSAHKIHTAIHEPAGPQ